MPGILDKFGKSSIDTDYAIATTVKTTRVSGVTVLEAFDLSRFADDTPVFFVTYKKTTDPLTDVVSVTNLVSWKALVNSGANTLTNMTLAPGYTDSGNDVGDFIECIPTSYWENSLIDGLLTSFNPDGTLKTAAVQEALNISGAIPPDYTPLANAPSSVTHLGQRSYEVVFTGVDYTDRVSPGSRFRTTRTVAAPTQSASLNGTTQYFNDTTIGGMTFTDDFVAGAWIKLNSYGITGDIISRYNGTSGWRMTIDATGRVVVIGYNAGVANSSELRSYQSIPVNKWVHVSAQLDMSSFTNTSTTSYIMIDGVDVVALPTRAGTNPTSLLQAGNIEIGSNNGGLNPFNGKIAQAFIASAKITQANVRTLMSQSITPAQIAAHSIISAWTLSGATGLTDINTTNANNLTAQNSATTTNADSPFGTQASGLISATIDYAIVHTATFSTDTTFVVQVPEGCTIPTSGGVSSVDYSGMKAPYGFPADIDKWRVTSVNTQDSTFGIGSAGSFYLAFGGDTLTVPVGKWKITASKPYEYGSSIAAVIIGRAKITTQAGTVPGTVLDTGSNNLRNSIQRFGNASATTLNIVYTSSVNIDVASQTNYKVAVRMEAGSGAFTIRHIGDSMGANSELYVDNAYL